MILPGSIFSFLRFLRTNTTSKSMEKYFKHHRVKYKYGKERELHCNHPLHSCRVELKKYQCEKPSSTWDVSHTNYHFCCFQRKLIIFHSEFLLASNTLGVVIQRLPSPLQNAVLIFNYFPPLSMRINRQNFEDRWDLIGWQHCICFSLHTEMACFRWELKLFKHISSAWPFPNQ